MNNKTSIIILTYNHLDYTKDCINSIRKYTEKNTYEIIVIDNASTDGTADWLNEQSDITTILNKKNLGFPKGCNIGIEKAEKENDILLLNNDTIVTEKWLSNLKKCLYSESSIGAVGAISNHNDNLQGCDFSYQNIEEMQKKAQKNNQSDSSKWEEKAFLIGYCMLIKREVMNKLVGLDEEYSPGYIEDNDLSLRILQLGYRLMLCHDVFIHHYLGTAFRKNKEEFNHLILKNRTYFEQKWNFSCFAFDETKNASIFLAESPQKVLDFDCGIGVSCLRIKYFFPQVDIVGVETDPNQRKIAKHFVPVICNYKELDPESFDTIFIGNALEKVDNPLSFLQEIKALLKPSGVIIGEICNMASIHHILELINDHWYYSNFEKKNHFTRSDLEEIFQNLGYQNGYIFSWVKELTKEEQDFLHSLEKSYISYNNTYYSFRFSK